MTISGSTILVMMEVLMMTTDVAGKCAMTTLTGAVFIVSSPRTACTALTATTADEAASAHDHNR